jgi:murein DD-endopeptidase MepM/ murein hydrolase activator NlpD
MALQQVRVLSLLAGFAMLPLPARAQDAAVGTLAVAAAVPSTPRSALPTGDDGSYRRAMLGWNAVASASSAAAMEALALPLAHVARLSSRFGIRTDPLGAGHRMHSGVDLPGRSGTSVMAAGSGVVSFVGWAGGYGNLIVIDHGNGLHTRYGHLLRPLVSTGDPVTAGSVIGLMGSTGRSTGPHLHYEVRIGSVAVDPLGTVPLPLAAPSLAPAQPVTPRWTGWGRPDRPDQLPTAVIR